MLPIEVWEHIIEECREDSNDLSALSLVCRSWMPKSRQLLFKEHQIKLQPSNTADFLSLLNDSKCTLAPLITGLYLNVGHHPYNPASPPPINELVQSLIDKGVVLTSLYIFTRGLKNLWLFKSLSSSITHLGLSDDYYCRWALEVSTYARVILYFLGNFRVLEALTLYHDAPGRSVGDDPITSLYTKTPNPPPSLPRLRRLELSVVWNAYLPWFLIPGVLSLPSLETLELHLASKSVLVAPPLLQSFLDLYSPSVKVLTLHLMWETLPALDLSRYTALRSITFDIKGAPNEFEDGDGLRKLADIVSACPNRSLTDPLLGFLTNDVEPVSVEGVRWILDSRYHHNESV